MALEAGEKREAIAGEAVYTKTRPPSATWLSPALKQFGRDCVIGLSLANWIMLRVWSGMLTEDSNFGYTLRHPARPVDLAAATVGVCVLAALFTLAATIARRSAFGRLALQWGAVLSIALVVNALRQVLTNSMAETWKFASIRNTGWRYTVVAAGLAGICSWAALMAWRRERVARIVALALLISSPFVLVTFSEAAIAIMGYNPAAYADKKLASPVQVGWPPRRVVWLIFDEMDERLTFVDRDPALRLPELDRFRAASFYAGDAWSPNRITLLSLPALLTGERVKSAGGLAPDDLLLTYESGRTAHWPDEPNLFSRARDAGFDSALAGWRHPYCRVLNRSLTACNWAESPTSDNSTGDTLGEATADRIRSLVETGVLSPFGQSLSAQHQVRNYRQILDAATNYAANPRLGVVFLHFPVPHPPYIYNSRTGRLDLANSPVHGYIDALALVDRTVGELRRTMEAAGLWERTAVLISADHGYRGDRSVDRGRIADRWVPFLLKLPGQHEPYGYPRHLETLRSAGLLLDILEGRILTPADAARSLDELPSGPNSRLDPAK
jgi:hypothetical protein